MSFTTYFAFSNLLDSFKIASLILFSYGLCYDAACMDTRAAVIPLQCCTLPTAISYKSETMGQNQSRLLSALSVNCHHSNCILFHILNGCNYSLQSGRYNWRHDKPLKTITSGLMPFIDQANEREYWTQDTGYIPTIAFRTADGTAYRNPAISLPKKECTNIQQIANDWEVLMDEEHKQIVFPPQIAETAKRSDITIYSERIKLTVPMEEDLSNAYTSKKCKYQDLVAECENRGRCTHYFPIEIGSRGFYKYITEQMSCCIRSPMR